MASEDRIKSWSMWRKDTDGIGFINKTNNLIESYNKQINEKFRTHHPNIFLFVKTREQEVREQVDKLNDIRSKRLVPKEYP